MLKTHTTANDSELQENTPVYSRPHNRDECVKASKSLKDAGINFLALDFDLTVVDIHTGGRWKFSAAELAEHVRPLFVCLIKESFNLGIHVAIATFSSQESLIEDVLGITMPNISSLIPVEGGFGDHQFGKQQHIENAIKRIQKSFPAEKINESTILLVDDDKKNIATAIKNGCRAFLFYPENPSKLFQDIPTLT